MMTPENWNLMAAEWQAWAGSALLRTTVVLAGAWLAAVLLRRRTATARHLVWTVALASAAAIPMLIDSGWGLAVPAPWIEAVAAQPVAASELAADRNPKEAAAVAAARSAAPTASSLEFTEPAGVTPMTASAEVWLAGLWIWGFSFFLFRLGLGHLRLRVAARNAVSLEGVEESLEPVEMGQGVRFLRSGREVMPMTWGWLRPTVLLPAGFPGWDAERRRMTLLHELAHVRRADWLTQTLAELVRAAMWFHPLAWLGLQRMRLEADRACDDAVLGQGAKASGYAEHLVHAAREYRGLGLRPWVAIAMAQPSALDCRVRHVLDPSARRGMLGLRSAAIGALGFVLVAWAGSVEARAQKSSGAQGEERLGPVEEPSRAQAAPHLQGLAALPQAAEPPTRSLVPQTQPANEPEVGPILSAPPAADAPRVRPRVATRNAEIFSKGIDFARAVIAGEPGELLAQAAEVATATLAGHGRLSKPKLSVEALETASAALRKSLGSQDENVRREAAEALGNLGSAQEANLEALSAALDDASEPVQRSAAEALCRLVPSKEVDREQAVRWLLPVLSASDAWVRREAVEAMGGLEGPRAIEAVTSALDDSELEVRREVVEALGRLLRSSDADTARASLPVLAGLLNDSEPTLRKAAVEALGKLRSIPDDVVPLLARATEDVDPDVQREAVEALGRMSSGGGRSLRWSWKSDGSGLTVRPEYGSYPLP